MTITPRTEGNMVYFGNSGRNVKLMLGIESEEFRKIHYHLASKYGLTIIKERLELRESTWRRRGNKKKAITSIVDLILHFEYICVQLEKYGVDISNLIKEFNDAQKSDEIYDIRHAISLAKTCLDYTVEGYEVEILERKKDEKSPDLKINGLYADLKVRQEPDMADYMMRKLGIKRFEDGKTTLSFSSHEKVEELREVLDKAISSRLEEGFEQADCVFIDLTYRKLSWNFGKMAQVILIPKPIKPKKYRLVILVEKRTCNAEEPSLKSVLHYGWLDFDPSDFSIILKPPF